MLQGGSGVRFRKHDQCQFQHKHEQFTQKDKLLGEP